jgi:hypothetical protein
MKPQSFRKSLEEVLKDLSLICNGIDKDEIDNGWWETSKGRELGELTYKKLINLIIDVYQNQFKNGYWVNRKYNSATDLEILLHFIEAGCIEDAVWYIKTQLEKIKNETTTT